MWAHSTEAFEDGNRHLREWFVNSGAQIRWTADQNMLMNGLTKDHRESRKHLARILQEGEWSIQKEAALVRGRSESGSKRVRKSHSLRATGGADDFF